MASTDKVLGAMLRSQLDSLGLLGAVTQGLQPANQASIAQHVHGILADLQLNPGDPSISDTPDRVAKMYCQEIFRGLDFDQFPKCTVFSKPRGEDALVVVDEIEVQSTCEHHLLPFIGKCAIGYIPQEHVMGLSKFNRVVDFFSRRPQLQERLTEQIAHSLSMILGTADIAVAMRCEHFCTKVRGVEDSCSTTITSRMLGKFFDVIPLRQEFLSLVRAPK